MALRSVFGVLVFVFILWAVYYALGQSKSQDEERMEKEQLEKEKLSLKKEIERTTRALEAIKKDKKMSLAEVLLVQKKLLLRKKKINTINEQLKKIDEQIQLQSEDIEHLKMNVSNFKKDYAQSILISYKFYRHYDPILYVFNADNFSSLVDRINYLKSYRDLRSVRLSQVKATHRVLEAELVRLSHTKRSQSQILLEEKDEFGILKKEEQEKQEVLQRLRSNEKKLANDLKVKQKRWAKIREYIQIEIKREISRNKKLALEEKKKQKVQKQQPKRIQREQEKEDILTFTDKDYKLAKNFSENKGRLLWPMDGYVTMNFGRNTVAEGSHISYNNSGITLRAKGLNKPIRSVFDGMVTSVQYLDGGMLITIRHGRYWTIYTPVYNPMVKPNQDVKTGTIIGYSGATQHTSELEFQIMKGTEFLNPQVWLKKM